MTNTVSRLEYLERLEDLLPTREVSRIRLDVDALIQDRIAAELEQDPDIAESEAERRAVLALGSPEHLAEELGNAPLTISLGLRRTFLRALAVLFAGHLLLCIVLTVAGSETAAAPGLLGPLPRGPVLAVLTSVLTIFLIDTGGLLFLFLALGHRKRTLPFPLLQLRDRWTRKDAIYGLVLLGLLAVIFNLMLGTIFSVRTGSELRPFLSTELMALVPFVNVVLVLFALRHVFVLSGLSNWGVAADALAALSAVALFVAAALQSELVTFPTEKLGSEAAGVLDDLIERVFMLVFVVGALLLLARFVRQTIRLYRATRI